MISDRRGFVIGAATFSSVAMAAELEADKPFSPEMFGAKGDGISNDTEAFSRMTAAVAEAGGGTIALRRTTYLVGRQRPGLLTKKWAFDPDPILTLRGLVNSLTIEGNGARLKCAAGLRFGTFDPDTSEPTKRQSPNYRPGELASPYIAMVHITQCSGTIRIEDLELDGSIEALQIGGRFGDMGYQVPAIGLFLGDNSGREVVRRLYTHHHGLDGLEIDGDDKRTVRSRFEDVRSEYNGRQGLSLVGGRGYDFVRCKFNHTGRSAVSSSPAAGVDIEAEGRKINRDLTFTDCEFVNNAGCGMVAEAGDSADAKFVRCKFVGATSWSAWPRKPRFVFDDCTFIGAVVNCFSSAIPLDATRFYACRFLDDPRLSPTGKVYQSGNPGGPIVNMGQSNNVLFSHCEFLVTHGARLPWAWHATYRDCRMVQTSPAIAYPRGRYIGRNTISGHVDLYSSKVEGSLTINGRLIPPG